MKLKSVTLAVLLSLIVLSSALAFADGTAPAPVLNTKNDGDVQAIFRSIVTEILKKSPWADKTAQAQLSEDSNFQQGLIRSQFLLNSTPGQESKGQISTQISIQGDMSLISTQIEVETNSEALYSSLSQSLETSIRSLSDFKGQLLNKVASIETKANRRKTAFGQKSSDNGIDEEQKKALIASLESSVIVKAEADTEVLTVNMPEVQSAISTLKQSFSQIQWLAPLKQFEIRVSKGTAIVTFGIEASLPRHVIENYDSYLSQKQNSEQGLIYPRNIVESIAPRIVAICSAEDYQQACFNKILSSCPRDVKSVTDCVDQAEILRKVEESKRNGSTLGVITNGANAVLSEGSQQIGDAVEDTAAAVSNTANDVINWATGDNDEE